MKKGKSKRIPGLLSRATLAAIKLQSAGIPAKGNEGFKSLGLKIADALGIDRKDVGHERAKLLILEYTGVPSDRKALRALRDAKRAANAQEHEEDKSFYQTIEWKRLRYKVLVKHGAMCQCCGALPKPGKPLHIDHIKPRSIYPELALEESNLQVLCDDCNIGKGNIDATDWRDGATLQ